MLALAVSGVPVTALTATLGVVVVVISIAMQQSLGNLAATVIILSFKPFKLGDVIEVEKAKAILSNLMAAEERVLTEPPARVFIQQLAASGVEVVAWPFVKAEDYALV